MLIIDHLVRKDVLVNILNKTIILSILSIDYCYKKCRIENIIEIIRIDM